MIFNVRPSGGVGESVRVCVCVSVRECVRVCDRVSYLPGRDFSIRFSVPSIIAMLTTQTITLNEGLVRHPRPGDRPERQYQMRGCSAG